MTETEKLNEVMKRSIAYEQAGADGFFPVLLKREEDIKALLSQLKLPLNVIALPGVPELKTLSKLGVARVSFGPGLLKIAIKAIKNLAEQLSIHNGLAEITENGITTDYLKNLVSDELRN